MQPDLEFYYWDRLTRTFAKGRAMSQQQRSDLADEIEANDPSRDLAVAAQKLRTDMLAPEEATEGYRAHYLPGLDVDAFRRSRGASAPPAAQPLPLPPPPPVPLPLPMIKIPQEKSRWRRFREFLGL